MYLLVKYICVFIEGTFWIFKYIKLFKTFQPTMMLYLQIFLKMQELLLS